MSHSLLGETMLSNELQTLCALWLVLLAISFVAFVVIAFPNRTQQTTLETMCARITRKRRARRTH
jgi:lipopolysaccharide export LptBFGC system permease protein LptF